VGLSIGDALGATVEFMTANEIRVEYGVHREIRGGGWLRLAPGQVTDDTEMSLYLARSIADNGGWSLSHGAEYLGRWMRSRPKDMGSTVRRGLRAYVTQGQLQVPRSEHDAGNGAAMRLLPLVLSHLGDEAAMERAVLEQARITHHHDLSDAGCLVLARLVRHALRGRSKLCLLQEAKVFVERFPVFRFQPYAGHASGYIVDTLQTVLHYFFRSRSFEECLVGVVNAGGDADTTGAIAGMLAGAFYGGAEIPQRWVRRMDAPLLLELRILATALVNLSRWDSDSATERPVTPGPRAQ